MIYLLLPAFNEEASIPKLLPKIKAEFDQRDEEYEIVVVNDGSFDTTGELLEDYLDNPSYPLQVITHPINRGLGETERDGFE